MKPVFCSLIIAQFIALGLSATGAPAQTPERVELMELRASQAPEGTSIVAVYPTARPRTVIVHLEAPTRMALWNDGTWEELPIPVKSPAGAWMSADGRVEVLDGEVRCVFVFSNERLTKLPLPKLPIVIHAGVKTKGAWIIGGANAASNLALYKIGPAPKATKILLDTTI